MSQTPEYFHIDGCDKQFFRCEKLRATLSIEACAANWRSGNDDNDQRRSGCRSCPIGAMHAGAQDASLSPLKGTLICSRCHRQSSRGWLIGKWLCVSCWNREREWMRGRNAKGNRPTKMLPLRPRAVRILECGRLRTVRRPLTQTPDEIIVGLLRDCKGTVTFMSNPNAVAQIPQLSLF